MDRCSKIDSSTYIHIDFGDSTQGNDGDFGLVAHCPLYSHCLYEALELGHQCLRDRVNPQFL